MFNRLVPTALPIIVLTLTVAGGHGATGSAIAGTDSACPPPDPFTSEVPSTAAEPSDRCAIDAEAYFREYREGEAGMTTTTAPASGIPVDPTGGVVAEAAAVGEPVPPIVIDEPGVLDDNTFVDSGDSQWVTTDDDRESTFALDVDTGSFNVAQTFLANGYRPEPDSIRVEEWVNAFTYGDAPATDADLALTLESASTAEAGTAVVRVGVTSRQLGAEDRPRLTSRSSSTRQARWTSASGSASCSRRWRCSFAACAPMTRSRS